MKYLDKNNKKDIRNWGYTTFMTRIQVTLFIEVVFFIIIGGMFNTQMPSNSDFGGYGLEVGLAATLCVGTIFAIYFNISTYIQNKKVKAFKNMSKEEQIDFVNNQKL